MENNERIDILERIARVDPPPFLFTRIEARIAARQFERPSRQWAWAGATALVALLIVNAVLMGTQPRDDRSFASDVGQFAAGMGLEASNQLYHE